MRATCSAREGHNVLLRQILHHLQELQCQHRALRRRASSHTTLPSGLPVRREVHPDPQSQSRPPDKIKPIVDTRILQGCARPTAPVGTSSADTSTVGVFSKPRRVRFTRSKSRLNGICGTSGTQGHEVSTFSFPRRLTPDPLHSAHVNAPWGTCRAHRASASRYRRGS